jgi:CheY-like chemotaxis protein/HPt (histidine-containing phosphotransfer) domain-containing protein
MLQAAGHRAVVVSDGREAVARWQSEPFDMILMDMHMPIMDGLEATEAIRSHEKPGQHIPIIALTAAAMKEDALACHNAGMDAYLTKPIHARQLQEMMAQFAPEKSVLESLNVQRDSGTSFVLSDDSPGTGSTEIAWETQSDSAIDDKETIDLRAAAGRVPGGLQGVRRLAEVFVGECADLMQTLRQTIPAGDAVVVQRTAHTLKGSASLFFAERVRTVAEEIELIAKDQDLQAAVPLLSQLEEEVRAMLRAINNFLDITAP